MHLFSEIIASTLKVEKWQIDNTLLLLEEGASIPFISRYRKERTGELTDVEIIEIDKLYNSLKKLSDRKAAIIASLEERDLLTSELSEKINKTESLNELEDIYLPYKPKRKTRASIAVSQGLEPLAKMIMSENLDNPNQTAHRFLSKEKGINTSEEALAGARDIIAEWINEKELVRRLLRRMFSQSAVITSKVVKAKLDEAYKYQSYHDYQENASRAAAHRVLAMFRGETEGFLKLKILPDAEEALSVLSRRLIRNNNEASLQKEIALKDSIKRLLFPSLENELRTELKQKADESSIRVFAENLRQLLLAPPLGQKSILAIDPGFKSGCKIVCLDRNGNLLANETIYPHPPQNQSALAMKKINSLVASYNIEAIAIGNGTAGRETEALIKKIRFNKDVIAVMVNENGASVYSASSIARKEFPDYDVTVRGSVSIGRRLMDPLAELVKIDPKSIGVGQYQHDVNQSLLAESLKTTVELCVNSVGVELNVASAEILKYVSGIGPMMAQNIVDYRTENGDFNKRSDLKKVKGLGNKAFEQSAGFLRIKKGANPLDASAVHPENYSLVNKMAAAIGSTSTELVGNKELIKKININDFVSSEVGLPTLKDIVKELEKPGRDPRSSHKIFEFDPDIKKISDLREGMIVPGQVTNITDFGAFVDIGIKENGLLHKSQIAEQFVRNPSEHLFINQQLKVKITSIDVERKRISLSLRF